MDCSFAITKPETQSWQERRAPSKGKLRIHVVDPPYSYPGWGPAKEFGQYWNSQLVSRVENKQEKIRSGKRAQSEAFGKRSHPIIGQLRFGLL